MHNYYSWNPDDLEIIGWKSPSEIDIYMINYKVSKLYIFDPRETNTNTKYCVRVLKTKYATPMVDMYWRGIKLDDYPSNVSEFAREDLPSEFLAAMLLLKG